VLDFIDSSKMLTYRQYLLEAKKPEPDYEGAEKAFDYAWELGKRCPELESLIAQHPTCACEYALRFRPNERWIEAEAELSKDPFGIAYAEKILKKRWPKLENFLLTGKGDFGVESLFNYAEQVVRGRWKEAEKKIATDPQVFENYLTYVFGITTNDLQRVSKIKELLSKDLSTNVQKWMLLKTELNEDSMLILNDAGMTREMQEYVVQHRPDLIGKIKNLDPELAKKYQHEQELGEVDL
jgi:hypothetical protein